MSEENSTIGTQIGGSYRITAKIGRGGFGDVFTGQHIIFTNRPLVAIKLLNTFLQSPAEREMFVQEAQLLHALTHAYILPILDAGIHNDTPYIVMEYAQGGSLRERLNRLQGRPLPLDVAIKIITQIGQALDYAHQQNIVHRDLKPDNILFNAKGDALLADFGLATVLSSARTRSIGNAGTPAYMAPEMFEGKVSIKSDQYALGCMAYELVTGRKPFDVEHAPMEVVWFQHTKVDPPKLTQFNSSLPQHIEQAILKAMSKQRDNRYTSVSIFIGALRSSGQQADKRHQDAKKYAEKAYELNELKRYEEGLIAADNAIRLDPNYALAYARKGYALNELKRYEEALIALDHIIRLAPNSAFAYRQKGHALSNLKRYEEALIASENAIRLDPSDSWAYNNKGAALTNLKRYEEALVTLDHAIRLNHNLAMAYGNKSAALTNLKRYEEALIAIDNAIRLDSSDGWNHNYKGYILQQLNRNKEAQQCFDRAEQLGYNA